MLWFCATSKGSLHEPLDAHTALLPCCGHSPGNLSCVSAPPGAHGFAQSEEDHRAWLRALDSLSANGCSPTCRTLSSPSFNGRQAGSDDDLRSAQWVARELTLAGVRLPLINNGSLVFPVCQHGEQGQPGRASWPRWFHLTHRPDPVLRTRHSGPVWSPPPLEHGLPPGL